MRNLLHYLSPHRWRILAATLLMAVSAVCELLLPNLMSLVLDKGLYGAAEADTLPVILALGGRMLVLALVSLAAVLLGYRLVFQVTSGFTRSLRSDLFAKVHTMTFEELGRIGVSNLVTRSTHDVGNLNWIVSMFCGSALIIPLMFLGGVVMCLRKDTGLSLIILVMVPLVFGGVLLLSRKITGLWGLSDDYCDKQNALVRERIRGIRVIRAFDREQSAHEGITRATRIMADNIIRANVSMSLIDPAITLLLNTAALLVVYVGGVRLERGSGLTAGDVFAVLQYLAIILSALVSASFSIVMLPHARVAARRLDQVLQAESTADAIPFEGLRFSGGITLEDVSFCYPGSEQPAVSHVSVQIRPGDKVSIIGGTGAGKSTLAAMLLAYYTPTQGRILFDGRDAKTISRKDVRANISAAPQKSQVYSGTLEHNLRMGRPDATQAELLQALDIAQLSEFVDEHGLDYKLEQSGANLSGGQKQRLAIARAILKQAPIYLFDDSFSALDFLTEAKLRNLLGEKIAGCTQIVITQRVVSAMRADCILVMDRGRLIDAGRHEALLARCPLYREIYDSQTGGVHG